MCVWRRAVIKLLLILWVGEERDLLEWEKQRLYGDNGGVALVHSFISFWTSKLWSLRSERWEMVWGRGAAVVVSFGPADGGRRRGQRFR